MPEYLTYPEWLNKQMAAVGVSKTDLAIAAGLTYTGLWNITKGYTTRPQSATREALWKAPSDLAKNKNVEISQYNDSCAYEEYDERIESEEDTKIDQKDVIEFFKDWVDFTPSDLSTIPEVPGIYVFYDVTDRPVYVGKSKINIRGRVRDHQTRFWFKQPVVARGACLIVQDKALCNKLEWVLITFLGKHALLNVKGATRDIGEVTDGNS